MRTIAYKGRGGDLILAVFVRMYYVHDPLVNSGYFVFSRYSDTHNLHVSFTIVIVAC